LFRWYLQILAIVLSVLLITASDCPVSIFWPMHCLFFDLRLLIVPLVSFGHCIVRSSSYGFWLSRWFRLAIVLSVLWFTASDCPIGIFWPLYCLFFELRLLIVPLVSFGHCIVCSFIYGFWLSRWYLLAIVFSVLRVTASDCPVGICWPLYCLFFELRLLIVPLVYFGHCIVCFSDCPVGILKFSYHIKLFREMDPCLQWQVLFLHVDSTTISLWAHHPYMESVWKLT
jgi:hypothetical protein